MTETKSIIELDRVTKTYRQYARSSDRLRELVLPTAHSRGRTICALQDISFSLTAGTRMGIVGANGSGKSTLLKIIAGVLRPTSGTVRIKGRVSALLELGAGFNPELSGRENIEQFCVFHGIPRSELPDAIRDVWAFSELDQAIEYPVKTYSSGMIVRLGFSCAVYVQPDILIVDEALSVGDAYFQNKCLHKIRSLLELGVTFLYVTHSSDSVQALCQQGLWLENGQAKMFGPAKQVGQTYQAELFRRMTERTAQEASSSSVADDASKSTIVGVNGATWPPLIPSRSQEFSRRVAPLREGTGGARILDIAILATSSETPVDTIAFGDICRIRVWYKRAAKLNSNRPCEITVGITNHFGHELIHFTSASAGIFLNPSTTDDVQVIDFSFENQLCPGELGIIAGIGTMRREPGNNGRSTIDHIEDYCAGGTRFRTFAHNNPDAYDLWGFVHIPYEVTEPNRATPNADSSGEFEEAPRST